MKTTVIISFIFGLIGGVVAYTTLSFNAKPSNDDLIKDFYLTENAVHVSPHSIRGQMDKGTGNFVLVDLRSAEEYSKEHIVGAVNIPAYKDPNTSAYDEVERIVGSFQKLIKDNQNKDIIVYCYSTPCMTGRKIGKILAEHDIYVKHLGIGWNEWRYYWNLWNHDGERKTLVENYIVKGNEPGTPKIQKTLSPCSPGELGC